MLFAHWVHIIVISVSTSSPLSLASYPQRRFHRFSFVPRCGVSLLINFLSVQFSPALVISTLASCLVHLRCLAVPLLLDVYDSRQSSYTDGFFQGFANESPYTILYWIHLPHRGSASSSAGRISPSPAGIPLSSVRINLGYYRDFLYAYVNWEFASFNLNSLEGDR